MEKVTSEFNANLREKIEWMQSATVFRCLRATVFSVPIENDMPLPGMLLGEFQTVDADTQSEAIEQF